MRSSPDDLALQLGAVTPIVLSGGSGTRLWPLSRTDLAKQHVGLMEEASPFQATLRRLAVSPVFARPIVVTGAAGRFMAADQAAAVADADAATATDAPAGGTGAAAGAWDTAEPCPATVKQALNARYRPLPARANAPAAPFRHAGTGFRKTGTACRAPFKPHSAVAGQSRLRSTTFYPSCGKYALVTHPRPLYTCRTRDKTLFVRQKS